jgi:alpha-L-rhamnosidase
MRKISCFFLFLMILASTPVEAKEKNIYTSELTCEYKKNPLGIGTLSPRLSWKIYSEANNQVQTAYQVLVAGSPKLLRPGKADLWDSKKVDSGQSILVGYNGKTPVSRQKCYWTVRIWDKDGKATSWAKPAYFEMGLLQPGDWKADWIKTAIVFDEYSYPSPIFRKEFNITKKIKSARLYCTSRGLYEFYLNGEKVGDQLFTPGWTSFEKRLQYQVYDVTGMFRPGENAAGVMLGNGWYRAFRPNSNQFQDIKDLEVLAQIEIEFTDGTKQTIKTDNSWKSSTGAVVKSEIYNGEIYDARLEKTGWSSPGFDDSAWKGVIPTQRDKNHMVSAVSEPVRKMDEITPVEIIYTPEGDTVIDMGQNMVGWCRLQVECPEGTTIKLRHAEVLDQDDNFYTTNLRSAKQEIIYTCKGGGTEIYEPRFTFQGFRYVAISGYPKEVTNDIIKGIVVHSDLERTGTFSCNNELINQLQHNIIWGQKGNFVDVPTDCPQRNERLGWTGDAQVFAPTACFNMQSAGFWTKWLYDLAADQHEDGAVPHVIPNVLQRGGSSGWADAAVIVPWVLYRSYGDTRILEQQYNSMKRWVEFMRGQAGDSYIYIPKDRQFGDWLAFATTRSDYPGATTDKDFLSTAYFYHSVTLLQQIAGILGKTNDAADYLNLQKKIKEAFNKEYVTPNGRLSSNTQTAYVVALTFGLLPENMEKSAAARLAEDVRQFGHITTGFLGTADICPILSKYGYLDEAYMLLYRKDYPSWLYPVTKGATTIWERWDGIKADGTFQNPGMNSFNHYAYGAVGNWLYKVVAGINADGVVPGYKQIVIKPCPGNQMNDVKASHESLYGTIVSQWEIQDNTLRLAVEIPANTSAEVFIPSTGNSLSENGKSGITGEIVNQEGLSYHFLKTGIGSGKYVFETNYKPIN